jgi:hypothetical protein
MIEARGLQRIPDLEYNSVTRELLLHKVPKTRYMLIGLSNNRSQA